MAQTVVGFFDDTADAQRAIQSLSQEGISRDRVDIRENNRTETTSGSQERSDDDESGVTRFFKSLFGNDEDEAQRYSRVASNSRVIVTVHAQSNDEAERAADILDDCGAVDVDEKAAQYSGSSYAATDTLYTGADRDALRTDETRNTDRNREETVIPRVQENLEVGKRVEERGGVRVRSRIVEKPVEEQVRLREERVNIERQPVNRPLAAGDEASFQEKEIELRERTEVPVVSKEARVVEEVTLSKDVTERQETVRDTVRNTEIEVDRIDGDRTGVNRDVRPDSNLRSDSDDLRS